MVSLCALPLSSHKTPHVSLQEHLLQSDRAISILALIMMDCLSAHPIFCAFAISAAKYHHNTHFKFAENLYSYDSMFSPLSVISFVFSKWLWHGEMAKYNGSEACLRSYTLKCWAEDSGLGSLGADSPPSPGWLTYHHSNLPNAFTVMLSMATT